MKFNLILGFGLGLGLLFSSSCKKDDDSIGSEFVSVSEDLTTQQDILEDNESEISEQIDNGLLSLETRGYPTRTWANTKGTYPNTLTIDYGTIGVADHNGRIRRGKIIVQISAPFNTVGAVRTVSHENFYVDDVKVDGTVTSTNQGPNASGQNVYQRNVVGRLLTFPSGKTINWDATHTLTQLEGGSTPDVKIDDVWSVTGSSNGVNRAGKSFSTTITEALISKNKLVCRWIVKGVISLTVDTKTVSVDFGDGACNNVAVVTLPDGSTKEVNIKRWW